jgi:hypothetical protein
MFHGATAQAAFRHASRRITVQPLNYTAFERLGLCLRS